MAEPEQKEEIRQDEKPPLPDNLGPAVMQPDLGAVANALSDEMEADERSDEEKEAAENAAKNPIGEDPTKGMNDKEKAEWWMRRSNHFEKDYSKEKEKRRNYETQYGVGGLNNSIKRTTEPPSAFTEFDGKNGSTPKTLDDVQDLPSYTRYILEQATKSFKHQMTEQQLDDKVETSEVHAREAHTGDDGLPPYDELIDEFVVPMVRKNPRIFELLRVMPDPAEASYMLGFLLKYPNFQDMMKSHSKDDIIKNINSKAKQAATVSGRSSGHQPSGKLTKAEIDAMSPEDFERELEKFRSGAG